MTAAKKLQREYARVPSWQLRRVLASAALWAGDDYRPAIAGVHVEAAPAEKRLSVIATNGFGLFVCNMRSEGDAEFSSTIGRDSLRRLKGVMSSAARKKVRVGDDSSVQIEPQSDGVLLSYEDVALRAANVPGFPLWRRILEIATAEKAHATHLSPGFLARVGRSFGGDDVKVSFTGHALDPVRFDGTVADADAFVILMPRRGE